MLAMVVQVHTVVVKQDVSTIKEINGVSDMDVLA